jgi:hypothetical protein
MDQDPKAQRLSVAHLFLWVTTSATLLAAERFWHSASEYSWEQFTKIIGPEFAAMATINGAAFAGLLLFIYRWCQGNPFARDPGEWLLCGRGVYVVIWATIEVLSGAVWRLAPKSDIVSTAGMTFVGNLVRFGGIAAATVEPVLFAVLALRQRKWSAWQIAFSLLAALYCCRIWNWLGQGPTRMFYDIPMIGSALTTIAVSLFEWSHSTNRPWRHWAGISASVGLGVVSACRGPAG